MARGRGASAIWRGTTAGLEIVSQKRGALPRAPVLERFCVSGAWNGLPLFGADLRASRYHRVSEFTIYHGVPETSHVFAQAYRISGFGGGLNYYRNLDWNWQYQAAFAGRRVEVPTYTWLPQEAPDAVNTALVACWRCERGDNVQFPCRNGRLGLCAQSDFAVAFQAASRGFDALCDASSAQ